MNDRPAVLGGAPAFPGGVAFSRPTIEEPRPILEEFGRILDSGWLTDGPHVERLEESIADEFGVDHCVAVSSCTIGLVLVLQALQLEGPVVVPSFTFSATAHAVRWNGLDVRFADVDPDTWCLRPEDIGGEPAAVVAVHVSGVPCPVDDLVDFAAARRIPLVFDAAHGAGTLVAAREGTVPVGRFGVAEVFSLTPTKVMSGAEGGLITTNDTALAAHLRDARNYGNPGDYDTRFPGLNARLSEFHAVLALSSLDHLEERVKGRTLVAERYRAGLEDLAGVEFQEIPAGGRSSYKDFTILVDAERFGCGRQAVVAALAAEGIATRPYYSPAVHRQQAYADVATPRLPTTERLDAGVISLPMWAHLPADDVDRIVEAFRRIHGHAAEVGARGDG